MTLFPLKVFTNWVNETPVFVEARIPLQLKVPAYIVDKLALVAIHANCVPDAVIDNAMGVEIVVFIGLKLYAPPGVHIAYMLDPSTLLVIHLHFTFVAILVCCVHLPVENK
jgi:hypothetical protein